MSGGVWRPIPGFEAFYEVSDLGQVRSLRRRRIICQVARRGYPTVTLSVDAKRRLVAVHRLVLRVFVGPCPAGMETRHLDGDQTNNRLTNLAYGTHAENMQDRLVHGTDPNASRTHCSRGHEYTPENTRVQPGTKSRYCRACHAFRQHRRYHRSKDLAMEATS